MISGEQIQKLRKEHRFSQDYMARQLGISRPTYVLVEKGQRSLTVDHVHKLAGLLGIPEAQLLRGGEHPPKKYEVILEKARTAKEPEPFERVSVPQGRVSVFKEVLLYLLGKVGAKPNVGETVLYKLLYFIDFDHYEKYETQLIGARYQKNTYGPTPVEFKKITEEMIEAGELEQVRSSYFQHEQKKYLPRREPNLGKLSGRDIKHIDEVLARLSDKNARELTDLSHKDVPWIGAGDGEIMKYEAVFYRTAETSVRTYEDDDD